MLRRIYDWCIAAAGKPYATWLLGAVSFAESSFFPVPPDVMLVPMSLARPDKAFYYAAVCTVTSVAGGVLGYLIGALLYDSVGAWVIGSPTIISGCLSCSRSLPAAHGFSFSPF
jgi:membrane protein YqaA with SNARE-associated domain